MKLFLQMYLTITRRYVTGGITIIFISLSFKQELLSS